MERNHQKKLRWKVTGIMILIIKFFYLDHTGLYFHNGFFFPVGNYLPNIFQINTFMVEKCKTRNCGIEVSPDKNYPNDVIIWMAMLSWDIERLAEDLYTRFGNNIIGDVGIKYNPTYGDVLNRPEFIPEIKEKLRIEKDYILTDGHNYKLINLFHLYLDMYYHSYYENDIHIGELYVKRRVVEYRKINSNDYENISEGMVNAYLKLHMEHVIDKFPPADSCYYKIRQNFLEHNGMEPPKEISLEIKWDKDTNLGMILNIITLILRVNKFILE
jgi:hypothetical protein